ncbi:hypothetical protein F5882DRAFT_439140 [Hyaloscypha sp. PMI_1271]|nr:hypothetical protein F5882DRAFT_439140 [Hyaloscypha sp. PMI_1271]
MEKRLVDVVASVGVKLKAPDHEADEDTIQKSEEIQGPNDPEVKEKIYKIDEDISDAMRMFLRGSSDEIVIALRRVYQRNLSVCATVLIKDWLKTRGNISTETQQTYQANLHQYSEAIRDYQTFEAFQKAQGPALTLPWLLMDGMRLATLERYQEQSSRIPASVIADARQVVYQKWPYTGNPGVFEGVVFNKQDQFEVFQMVTTFLQRLETSLLGGFAVVVPMLIMTLHPTLLTALLTTSLFVFAVAILIAVTMKTAEPKDVLGATAAYAAVLVVFVGTSTTTDDLRPRVVAIIVAAVIIGSTVLAFVGAFLFAYVQQKRANWFRKPSNMDRLPSDVFNFNPDLRLRDILRKGLVP